MDGDVAAPAGAGRHSGPVSSGSVSSGSVSSGSGPDGSGPDGAGPRAGTDAVGADAAVATASGERAALVGVDLGGTKIAAALVSVDGALLTEPLSAPTPARQGAEAILDVIAELVVRLLAGGAPGRSRAGGPGAPRTAGPTTPLMTPLAVGIGAAGVIDSGRGVVLSSTDALTGWAGTDVAGGVAARLAARGVTAADGGAVLVHVDNDVNAYAAGEAWLGAGAGRSSALVVAVGTGVGGAVVLEGRVLHGAHFMAGEMGHMPAGGAQGEPCTCGRPGHLEAVAAGPQIARRYREAAGTGTPVTGARDVERLASQGDAIAQRVYREAAVALGRAIAGVATVLDPEVVLVSGGLARSGDLWWGPLRRTVAEELIDVVNDLPVLPAVLGTTAPIIGAAHEADLRRRARATVRTDPTIEGEHP